MQLLFSIYVSSADIGIAPERPPKAPIPWTAALGNAATPHRQEHSQEPPVLIVPVPETMVPELTELAEAEVAAAAAVVAMVVDAVPPAITAVVPVPFCAIAMAWNMAWVLLAVGLIEKVIPFPQ